MPRYVAAFTNEVHDAASYCCFVWQQKKAQQQKGNQPPAARHCPFLCLFLTLSHPICSLVVFLLAVDTQFLRPNEACDADTAGACAQCAPDSIYFQ